MTLSQWNNPAYLCYIRTPRELLASISKQIASHVPQTVTSMASQKQQKPQLEGLVHLLGQFSYIMPLVVTGDIGLHMYNSGYYYTGELVQYI